MMLFKYRQIKQMIFKNQEVDQSQTTKGVILYYKNATINSPTDIVQHSFFLVKAMPI